MRVIMLTLRYGSAAGGLRSLRACLGICLLKNTHNLGLKFREFHRQHARRG